MYVIGTTIMYQFSVVTAVLCNKTPQNLSGMQK